MKTDDTFDDEDEDWESAQKQKRHAAIVGILVKYCGLMDMIEEDEENKPFLRQIMEDEESAVEYLLSCVRSKSL